MSYLALFLSQCLYVYMHLVHVWIKKEVEREGENVSMCILYTRCDGVSCNWNSHIENK